MLVVLLELALSEYAAFRHNLLWDQQISLAAFQLKASSRDKLDANTLALH